MKKGKEELITQLSVSSIVEHGNLMMQFERLEDERQQKAQKHHGYGLMSHVLRPSPEMVTLKKRYNKLVDVLCELDKTNSNAARKAAIILVEKLKGVYEYHCTAQQPPKPKPKGFTYESRYSTYENALIPPKQLLEQLETEFIHVLKPLWHIRPQVKAAIMLVCGVCAAVAMVSLCMTAMIFLPSMMPALKPAVSLMTTPLGNTPLSIAHIPLLNVCNIVSAGIGALTGGGVSFFAMRRFEAWRFREFRACVNAVKQFSEQAKKYEQDSTQEVASHANHGLDQ